MEDVDAAYFLVHSMGGHDRDFGDRDRRAACVFREAAADARISRIVFLGGLGDERDPRLSRHLSSRHEVGRLLAAGPVPVTELRAAIIIGSGSASFEMLRNLVERLPVMVTPRWVATRCQPIAIRDVLHYLLAVLTVPATAGRVIEVGGPDVLTYREMMDIYAHVAGLPPRWILPVPVLTPRLSSLWVGLVTPLPSTLARPLIDSLVNEVVVHENTSDEILPHDPLPFREAVRLALTRIQKLDVATVWSGAELSGRSPAEPMTTDPHWAGGTLLEDVKVVHAAATPAEIYRVVTGIGGRRGWYSARLLWEVRGLLDVVLGGSGMRRGRRHPDELRIGDPVDLWRVEALVPGELVRLRAEMRLPGVAWLEFRIHRERGGARLEQRARFYPRGLLGRMYWWFLLPFHAAIFGRMARNIARAAERRTRPDGRP